jgi:CelD/BcsL family acetyltransferase involved in cellulose biosynthesis
VTAVPGSALSGNLVARWSALQLADPEPASPFFRPEFTQAVARVRDGVFVAVVEDGRVPVGFLPFERARLGIGKPVGRHLSGPVDEVARSPRRGGDSRSWSG